MINPYHIVLDRKGCHICNHGESWGIEGPDGILESVSYDCRAEAQEEAEKMNRIYHLGYTAGREANWDRTKAKGRKVQL
jgi:hypothetical protein